VNKTGNTHLWTTGNSQATVGGQLSTPVLNNCVVVWCSIMTICLPGPTSLQHKWQSACQAPCRQWTTQNAYLCCLLLKWISAPLQGCFLTNTSLYICIYTHTHTYMYVCVYVCMYVCIYEIWWIPLLFYERSWIISTATIQVPKSQTTFLARNIWKIPLCKAIKVLSLVAN